MTLEERLIAAGYDDVILLDGPSYDDALVGITDDGRAVYDYSKMVSWLVSREGLSESEALDFVECNTMGTLLCLDAEAAAVAPVIMYPV